MIKGTIQASLLGAALLIGFPATGWAQEPAAVPAGEAAREGITVHGHWTIEVIRDGKVVERREFANALETEGGPFLADLLARDSVPGDWYLQLNGLGENGPCGSGVCEYVETDLNDSPTPSSPDSGDNAGSFLISHTTTADTDGAVERVKTGNFPCGPTVTPESCPGSAGGGLPFTTKDISAVNFLSGDKINTTVVISFN